MKVMTARHRLMVWILTRATTAGLWPVSAGRPAIGVWSRPMQRDLDLSGVINKVFGLYGEYARVLLPVALAVFVIEAIVAAVLIAIAPALIFLAIVAQIIASTLYQGMVVELVRDVQDGRLDQTPGEMLQSVTPVLGMLIGAGLLAGLGIAVGFFFIIIPGLFLLTIWSVVAPVVVVEKPGAVAALGRSRELVRRNGWQVFGAIVVFFVMFIAASFVFGAIGAALGDIGRIVLQVIASVLTAPLLALVASVLYFELKAIKGEAASGDAGVAAGGFAEPVAAEPASGISTPPPPPPAPSSDPVPPPAAPSSDPVPPPTAPSSDPMPPPRPDIGI